ncbi:hypothetical protein BX286_0335 [Streptomyces sp. 3211.6]|nr:hypothetical protein BX286_0335 [Streptomyces sp. 3211.6]
MIEDGATDRGSVTTVRRVGETIRRPAGPWTPAVQALLAHLESAGFTRAPRAPGTDGGDGETLCTAYGAHPEAVLDALDALRSREAARTERLGGLGQEAWATFPARGDAAETTAERSWLRAHRALLLAAR